MARKRRRGVCRLCGSSAVELSKEDVYSTWLRKFVRQHLMDPESRLPDKVILRACDGCNDDLGEKFENPVAPILKPLVAGQEVTLTPDEVLKIANWLWLKDIE